MSDANMNSVPAAFEILLEEIEAEIAVVDRAGSKAFEAKRYPRAKELAELASRLTNVRQRLADLRSEWQGLAKHAKDKPAGPRHHLPRGVRTPEEAYRQPILQALLALGGSAAVPDVLERVGKAMKGVLKDVDHQAMASDSDMLRWRNAAQWARPSMVKEGLLKPDSPRGVWEISEAGRRYIKE